MTQSVESTATTVASRHFRSLVADRRRLPGLHPQLRRRQRRRHRRHRRPARPAALPRATSASTRSGSTRGTRRRWPTRGYDVADYRDIEPVVRHARRGRGADRRGARARPPGDPRHRAQPHLRPSIAWFRGAAPPPGDAPSASRYHLPRRQRARRRRSRPTTGRAAFGGPAWTRAVADGAGQWYLHLFAPEQPDLNWEQPGGPRRSSRTILRFWFDRGVDGFRIDVAHGLAKDPGAARPRPSRRPARRRSTPGRPPGLGPGRRARDLPRLAGGRRLLRADRGLRRRGVGAEQRAARRATCGPTSCTPRSTSTSCSAPWRRRRAARR